MNSRALIWRLAGATADDFSSRVTEGLRADGVAIPNGRPTQIQPPDVADASCIFAVGCTLPAEAVRSGKVSDWNDVPDDQGYPAMRGATVRHVRVLLDQLDTARRNK